MKRRFDPETDWEALQAKVIGLGEQSLRKSHYAQSRDRLRELELFRRLLDASEEIVLVADLAAGSVSDANGGACRQLGYRRDELIGLPLEAVCASNGRQLLARLRGGTPMAGLSLEFCRRDGGHLLAEGSASIETLGDEVYACLIARDVSERQRHEAALHEAGRALEALNATLEQRVRERTAELAAALDELRGLNATLEQARDQLVHAETLAGLGRMVAVIAHELNTPIGNSRIAATTLLDEARMFAARGSEGLRRWEFDGFVERVLTGTALLDRALGKAAALIAGFKQVAVDQSSAQRRRFDLSVVMAELRLTMEPALKRARCRVDWQVADGLPMDSYPGPLGQVLINLLDNALLHAFDGVEPGQLRVWAAAAEATAGDAPGDWVRIVVADDGVGISEPNLKRIFEPFFTTRLGRGGSGLGLNIAYGIVTGVLGGKLTASSAPGHGSTFEMLIPRVAPPGDAARCRP